MKTIAAGTLSGCKGAYSITIPKSVLSIGDGAFGWRIALASITIPGSVETLVTDLFFDWESVIMDVGDGEILKIAYGVLFHKDMKRIVWCSP